MTDKEAHVSTSMVRLALLTFTVAHMGAAVSCCIMIHEIGTVLHFRRRCFFAVMSSTWLGYCTRTQDPADAVVIRSCCDIPLQYGSSCSSDTLQFWNDKPGMSATCHHTDSTQEVLQVPLIEATNDILTTRVPCTSGLPSMTLQWTGRSWRLSWMLDSAPPEVTVALWSREHCIPTYLSTQ